MTLNSPEKVLFLIEELNVTSGTVVSSKSSDSCYIKVGVFSNILLYSSNRSNPRNVSTPVFSKIIAPRMYSNISYTSVV